MCCKLEAADAARVNLQLTATNILFSNSSNWMTKQGKSY